MKKNIILFGLISGLIVAVVLVISTSLYYTSDNFAGGMWVGYASMIIAFSSIFICVINYRDKINNGSVSFKKAFQIGLLITFIASSIYVAVWLVDYYLFVPDFMDKYSTYVLKELKAAGASPIEVDKKAKEMANFKKYYKNPLLVVAFTYLEILPVGLLISLISALALKRRPRIRTDN